MACTIKIGEEKLKNRDGCNIQVGTKNLNKKRAIKTTVKQEITRRLMQATLPIDQTLYFVFEDRYSNRFNHCTARMEEHIQ